MRKDEKQDPEDIGREEILNVAKLLDDDNDVKLIHEERTVSRHLEQLTPIEVIFGHPFLRLS